MAFTPDSKSPSGGFLKKEDGWFLLLETLGKILIGPILNEDSRTSAGSFTQDGKTLQYLWISTIFPWATTTFPWYGLGAVLTLDNKN